MLPTFKQSILVLSFLRKMIAKKRAKKLVKRLVIEIITHWSLEIHDASYVHTKRLKVCRITDLVLKLKITFYLHFFTVPELNSQCLMAQVKKGVRQRTRKNQNDGNRFKQTIVEFLWPCLRHRKKLRKHDMQIQFQSWKAHTSTVSTRPVD